MLMLDAAFPPPPEQLLADMDQVGAQACAVYVWGGASRGWTPQHVAALRTRGKYVLPIVVPGDNPPADTGPILAAVRAFGFLRGPVMTDYETTSEPSASWAWLWETAQHAAGYVAGDYGTRSELGRYPAADDDWIASWLRTGRMDPVPELPAGVLAWQFVDDVVLPHGAYDVSIVDPALFGAPSRSAAGSEGTMIILTHPVAAGRLDLLVVDANRRCAHTFSDGGAGGLDGPLSWNDYGALPDGPIAPGTLAACWDNLNRLCIGAADAAGAAYLKVVGWDGGVVQDWTPIQALVTPPAGVPGPDVRPDVAKALVAAARLLTPA